MDSASLEGQSIVNRVYELVRHPQVQPSAGLDKVVTAMIAAEDRRFFQHRGVDWLAIIRAAFAYFAKRKISGASTIEQQLVRTLRQRYELTLQRKISEMLLARTLSRTFTKREIAITYLDVAYFGWRATGVVQAARRFGIALDRVSDREAATLAAMLKLPMPKQANAGYRARLDRRISYVLQRMSDGMAAAHDTAL